MKSNIAIQSMCAALWNAIYLMFVCSHNVYITVIETIFRTVGWVYLCYMYLCLFYVCFITRLRRYINARL